MTASYGTRTTLPRCHENPFHPCRFVGIFLMTLVILLPTSSDACDVLPRYESMMPKDVSKDQYRPGEQIEFKCRPGYTPITPPLPTIAVCQPDNTWSPLQEACTRKLCPQLGEPVNGQVVYVNGSYNFGSQAHFLCNEGYFLLGTKVLYCELGGNNVDWSDAPPQCESNYELVGSKVVYCELSGNNVDWSGNLPQCEKILCQPPGQIPNGRHTGSDKDVFEYNEVVTYSCNPSGGSDPYSLVGESKLICSGRNVWSSNPPVCKVVKCPYPVVENGRQVAGFGKTYYYKARVVFECNPGFHLKGNSTIICNANSVWEPEKPECIQVSTPLSTKSPISSVTVSTPLSTKSPISSVTDVKPTIPATPSVTSHPGSVTLPGVKPTRPATSPVPRSTESPTPSDESPKRLGGGIIAVIVIVVVLAIVVICCIVRKVLQGKKKREREVSATGYSTYQNKSSTPTEQTN